MDDPLVTIIALAAFIALAVVAIVVSESKLNDPDDLSVIELEQLPEVIELIRGDCSAVLYRQSGNVHRDLGTLPAAVALKQVMTAMRRAKIDAIAIQVNSPTELRFRRLYHNHRGRSEGKRLGGAHLLIVT